MNPVTDLNDTRIPETGAGKWSRFMASGACVMVINFRRCQPIYTPINRPYNTELDAFRDVLVLPMPSRVSQSYF